MNHDWEEYRERHRQKRIGRVGRVTIVRRGESVILRWRQNGSYCWERVGAWSGAGVVDRAHLRACEVNLTFSPDRRPRFRQVSVREASDIYIASKEADDVDQVSGETITKYSQQLDHILKFAEGTPEGMRCRLLHEIDSEWCEQLSLWLTGLRTTPNGGRATPRNPKRPLCKKHRQAIKRRLRSVIEHARQASPSLVPPDFRNPMTTRMVGKKTRRASMLSEPPVSDVELVKIIGVLDRYALGLLAPLFLYGPRPSELGRILVVDYDYANALIFMGSRAATGYRTKGRVDKHWPLTRPLAICVRTFLGKAAGPLFVKRKIFERKVRPAIPDASEEMLAGEFEARRREERGKLRRQLKKQEVDDVSERLWADAGAADGRDVRRELARAARKAGLKGKPTPKDCRHLFASLCQRAGLAPGIIRLLMGHAPVSGDGLAGLARTPALVSQPEGQLRPYLHVWVEVLRESVARVDKLRRPLLDALERRADELAS
ncbi:MAG: hypothetical protein ACYS9X_03490 [Planctomycetota bacterium]|jgi:integrase